MIFCYVKPSLISNPFASNFEIEMYQIFGELFIWRHIFKYIYIYIYFFFFFFFFEVCSPCKHFWTNILQLSNVRLLASRGWEGELIYSIFWLPFPNLNDFKHYFLFFSFINAKCTASRYCNTLYQTIRSWLKNFK